MKVVNHSPKMLQKKEQDRRISVCSKCKKGIFSGQDHHWATGRYCGLIHDLCEEA